MIKIIKTLAAGTILHVIWQFFDNKMIEIMKALATGTLVLKAL
jgi:hypothetical protein